MRSVALTIERAIIQASKELESIPEDIILSFSSHATLSDIITTQYVRGDKTSNITMEEIDTIIKKIEADSFSRIREKAKREISNVFTIVFKKVRCEKNSNSRTSF